MGLSTAALAAREIRHGGDTQKPVHAVMLTVTADDPAAHRREMLEELKNEAIAELERRGYEVRGKTPGQIRQILRRRPTKPKSNA
jgi:hypothetical protein